MLTRRILILGTVLAVQLGAIALPALAAESGPGDYLICVTDPRIGGTICVG